MMENWRWQIAQAAEIRWWQWYLRKKDPLEYRRRKLEYWRRILDLSGLEPTAGQRVLDAGCGPAGIFLLLNNQQVDAIDPLLNAYVQNLPHFEPSHYPWVQFFNCALESFRPQRPYEVVFCLNAINHVADLNRAFDRLIEALQPGGMLVLSVDVHRRGGLKRLFRLLPGDVLHPHQHGLDDYQSMIESRGCRIVSSRLLRREFIFDFYLLVAQLNHKG